MSLRNYRDRYLDMLLDYLWQEWSTLGVAGREGPAHGHVIDPEALLLFTCSLGRHDQRLFDEVLDWLTVNGRFLNVHRMKSIARNEEFRGRSVLRAVADWLSQQKDPMKWKLLAKQDRPPIDAEPLFYLPDGRPLPLAGESDTVFLKHGLWRNPVEPRGYALPFPPNAAPCLLLRMRALFGVNARCDVLTHLALNETGHPRKVARELYYSQKAIHDVMTDMARSGIIHSSRAARERVFRIATDTLPFLTRPCEALRWINWPVLLSTAETVWHMVEELHAARLEPSVESSEIHLTMKPLLDRLVRAPWGAAFAHTRNVEPGVLLDRFAEAFQATVSE